MNFVEELKWRGMLHDIMPGTEEELQKGMAAGYVGFDPTAPSLTVGNLVTVMLLVHFQRAGHKPIALVGGATGMIGDPSGKDKERNLLSKEILKENERGIEKELRKILDFNCGMRSAEIVNNWDWFKGVEFLDMLRDIGKYLTLSYLLSKGFVKDRLKTIIEEENKGISPDNPFREDISYTEFNYILMQAYDFLWLLQHKNCTLQMGGSDQWGNITAGTELIRKKLRKKTHGLTCPLITKADGTKFGKSEEGNIWLNPEMTSPYKFYQFWLNVSDEEAKKYIRIFTLLSREEVENLEKEHVKAPHLRLLQKALAKDVTISVHSSEDYNAAVDASEILFGKGTTESLKKLSDENLLAVFEGVPQDKISRTDLDNGIGIIAFLSEKTSILPSKSEARRMIKGRGIKISGSTPDDIYKVTKSDLLNDKYILVQKGKKNYCLVTVK